MLVVLLLLANVMIVIKTVIIVLSALFGIYIFFFATKLTPHRQYASFRWANQ